MVAALGVRGGGVRGGGAARAAHARRPSMSLAEFRARSTPWACASVWGRSARRLSKAEPSLCPSVCFALALSRHIAFARPPCFRLRRSSRWRAPTPSAENSRMASRARRAINALGSWMAPKHGLYKSRLVLPSPPRARPRAYYCCRIADTQSPPRCQGVPGAASASAA